MIASYIFFALTAAQEVISPEDLEFLLQELKKRPLQDLSKIEGEIDIIAIDDVSKQLKNQKVTLEKVQKELDKKGLKVEVDVLKDRLEKGGES